jgi:pSer/pThr/pTyr-binding forkhead associated (FHA) protein
MALLKILNGDSTGVTYTVGSTALMVGRAEGNDLQIPDGSVSSRHCEMWVDSVGNLLVKDLGSTNGTFINGQRVTEAFVTPGQKVRLGNLEFLFEPTEAATPMPVAPPAIPVALNMPPPPVPQAVRAAVPAIPVPIVNAPTGPNACFNHAGTAAAWICPRCGGQWCKSCAKEQRMGMKIIEFCPSCNAQCRKASDVAKDAAREAERPKSFTAAIAKSFRYPFIGNGLILLITGTIFYGLLSALLGSRGALFARGYGWIVWVIMYGYLFAYLQKIVVCSAAGDDEPPPWPEVTDIGSDILQPFFQFGVTLLISFAPAWFASSLLGPLPGFSILMIGLLFFPMAFLGIAMSDSFACLNPVFVASSITKAPKDYLLTCVAFGVIAFVYQFVKAILAEIPIPIFPSFVFWFLFLVAVIIGMRVLGFFYFMNREKLDWGV